MKDIDRLNRLRIASPCPTAWEQMAGDDRVRFCDPCNLHVYNIGQMTPQSNSDGRFAVAGLASGAYDIAIESPGFKRLELKKFMLAAKETVSFDPILTFDATTDMVGLLVDMPSIDTSTPSTIIIRGEMLRKLHINN